MSLLTAASIPLFLRPLQRAPVRRARGWALANRTQLTGVLKAAILVVVVPVSKWALGAFGDSDDPGTHAAPPASL